jgi:signal transduction histidine kinase
MQVESRRGLQALCLQLAAHSPELPTILELLLSCIEQSLGLTPVVVFLYDPDSGQYILHHASKAIGTGKAPHSIPGDGALVRWLAECIDPICVWADQNRFSDQDLYPGERQVLESLGLALFLPVKSWSLKVTQGQELGGWVAVGPRPSGPSYSPNDLAVLAALVSQAALAIENVLLHQAVEEAGESSWQFMDFVAHELKQPMTAIQGYAKMLVMGIGGELADTQRQFAQVINANADRMGRLINNLLEASRLEAGRITLQLAPLDVRELIEEAIAAARSEIETRQQTLAVEIPPGLPPVMGDRDRLLQILSNLISNAYKYTPEGGSIRITAETLSGPEVPARYLAVSISDSGIGLSDHELSQVGERFFRAEQELVRAQPGSGLGVYIVRQLITLHGGHLTIRSEPDEGSTFRFTLPIASNSIEQSAGGHA